MAPLLRRRLTCFYCNSRSSKFRSQGLRQWECEHCDAVNYLDENGGITDPPASKTPDAVRYAQTIDRAISPVNTPAEDDLFCSTCIKNQNLLTQALASYLPPTTDPNYVTYEASYPAYRKNLEKRYPQVCSVCEPRVKNRIRQTGYLAKTDHLRRMMDKSRGGITARDTWSWRLPVVYSGALGWWTSLLGQVLWNVMGALVKPDDGLQNPSIITLSDCVRNGVQNKCTEPVCVAMGERIASGSLILGLFCIWWNPRLSYKIKGRKGRVVGWAEYYKLQVIILLARLVALYMLGDLGGFQLDQKTTTAGHAVMMIFTTVASLASYWAIQIDNTPFNPFLEKSELHSEYATTQSGASSLHSLTKASRPAGSSFTAQQQPPLFDQQFPINSLAAPQPHRPAPYHLPTPPPDDREDDAMDWTPSRANFEPEQRTPIHQPMPIGPSPFHGKLPPAPKSQAHRLRNPSQPHFTAASSERKQNFFERMTKGSPRVVGDGSDDEAASTPRRPQMADQRFFPATEQKADTGLENIFNAAFSLRDEPPEVRALREQHETQTARQQNWTTNQTIWPRLLSFITSTVACVAWTSAPKYSQLAQPLQLAALGGAAVVAGMSFVDAARKDKDFRRYSSILIYFIQVTIATLLGSAVNGSSDISPSFSTLRLYNNSLGNFPIYFLTFMSIQELLTLIQISCRKLSTASSIPPEGSAASTTNDSPGHSMFGSTPSPPRNKSAGLLSNTIEQAPPPNFLTAPAPTPMETAINSPALSFSSIASASTSTLKTPTARSRTSTVRQQQENFTPSTALSGLSLDAGGVAAGARHRVKETPPAGSRLSGGVADSAWWEGLRNGVAGPRPSVGGGRKSRGNGGNVNQWGL
ncbi:MAG: hypothetical protein MMC33_008284 [Icmadophila ericetorum]|nr:hypothetical protein [Icmadophila ericetorum]